MLSEKETAEKLDENNQQRLKNIVGKCLYYDIEVDPTFLMELNSLAAVQTNPTIETAKQVTQVLNYRATHPDTVTEYRRIGMILRIYLDAFHISEPDARIRAGGYSVLGPKSNTPIQSMPHKMSQYM